MTIEHGITSEWVTLDAADGTRLPVYTSRPAAAGARPGLLVFQEAFGVNAHIRDVTERFAQAGYIAAAPSLFHRTDPTLEADYNDFAAVMPHLSAMTDEGQSVDFGAAYDWLISPTGGAATSAGSVGYCMGGRTSFLAALSLPLKAAVSYYGGGIAPSERRLFPPLMDRIPELTAPILFFWGGLDAHIGPEQRRAIEDGLAAAGKVSTQVIFSQANHAFFCDAREAYEPNAARQSWALTLDFLAAYL